MKINQLGGHHVGIEKYPHPLFGIIYQAERCDGPGDHTQHFLQQLSFAERKPRRTHRFLKLFDIDLASIQHDGKPELAFLVLKKKILAMGTGQMAAMKLRLLDRENGGVTVRFMGDAQILKAAIQFFTVGGYDV